MIWNWTDLPTTLPKFEFLWFFPYAFLKQYVFRNNLLMVEEMKVEIMAAVENINTETLTAITENFR
jgi:hypothetical protein